MNVKLKVSYDYIKLVCDLYDYVTFSEEHLKGVQLTKEFRANLSIVEEVIIKFKKKLLHKKSNQDFRITLKDYQGFYLCKFLYENINKFYLNDLYEKTLLTAFYTKIDKEL